MKPKVYIETTIISYLAARPSRDLIVAAHQQITREWWDQNRLRFDVFVSQLVLEEAAEGDQQAARLRLYVARALPVLRVTEEATGLSRQLTRRRTLPTSAATDALHIAIATVHEMDYLMTWNCRHLANAEIQSAISVLCDSLGYHPPRICTPEELMGG